MDSKAYKEELKTCREELKSLITDKNCNPFFVRLAWHDCGTYNKDVEGEWPSRGGANGSIRFEDETNRSPNIGLRDAIKLLEPVKEKCPLVSYADIFQMASVIGIELAGGPKIRMRYGRRDATKADESSSDHILPAPIGKPSWPCPAQSAEEHLRIVFNRMGFNDQEIVALSGAHTLGRAHPDRSAFGKDTTQYTKNGPGRLGGTSWTKHWLVFDNTYFIELLKKEEDRDKDLLVLETDACLALDPKFRDQVDIYSKDQDAFFKDYAKAHAKLSELGVEWVEGGPIVLEDEEEENDD